MPDYSKGKIYIIRFIDCSASDKRNDNHIYIGSTIQPLAVRFASHKRDYKCSLCKYINDIYNGDWSKCYIELFEECSCSNKEQLNKKEGEIIRGFKKNDEYIVINKNIAGRSFKEYYEANRDVILKRQKKHYDTNTEHFLTKQKEYYEANKAIILAKRKVCYQLKKN